MAMRSASRANSSSELPVSWEGGRPAWHFPRTPEGVYAGHHPADGPAAVAHLAATRASGTRYLLLPATAFWWLDHYLEFRLYLEDRCERIWDDRSCLIYRMPSEHR